MSQSEISMQLIDHIIAWFLVKKKPEFFSISALFEFMWKGEQTRIDLYIKNLVLIVYLIGISCKGKNLNRSVCCVFTLIWESKGFPY